MTALAPLANLIQRFQEQTPIRASSLIVTVYGDAIEPHGGAVWLGSLIQLLEPMGINQRLICTSVFRLTKDGWLKADKVGRRSYYSLTGAGRRRFEKAFKRVYSSSVPAWVVSPLPCTSSARCTPTPKRAWPTCGSSTKPPVPFSR